MKPASARFARVHGIRHEAIELAPVVLKARTALP
jgi:hypothetical protein